MVIRGFYFVLNDRLSFGEGSGEVRLKLDVQCQGGGRILGVTGGVGGVEVLENLTFFLDNIICVSSL